MKRERVDPEFDADFDNDYDYAIGHDERKRRWSELERKSRRERRDSRPDEFGDKRATHSPRDFKP